jgi:hypothetical protein
MSFKGSHNTTSKKDTVERHRRMREFQSPLSGKIWFSIISSSKSTTSDENDVGTSSHGGVHGENWCVEVFKRVVTSSTTTRPLEDDGERRMCASNGDGLSKGFCGARLEGNIFDAEFPEVGDPDESDVNEKRVQVVSNFKTWDTSTNSHPFNANALSTQALDKIHLPIE